MDPNFPVKWHKNPHALAGGHSEAVYGIFPPGTARAARSFHRQIPNYKMSPLKSLSNLASMLGLGGIWVKDESQRMALTSFKILGGSYAIYRVIKELLGVRDREIPFEELTSHETRAKLGDLTFAAATDGNHGRGVAWAANAMNLRSVIYVHKFTAQARIDAIARYGADVRVVDGTYDDAVRQASLDAEAN
ncbi:MAG TPA: pyridoxal-phosphate dependent enzyme, partial [Aggregatilineales bacterium]|nr:pyridoxal-phosphate dependent enzyme [Aggregatilineales bacterium]